MTKERYHYVHNRVTSRCRLNKVTLFLTRILLLWLWHLDSELDTPHILLAWNKRCPNSGEFTGCFTKKKLWSLFFKILGSFPHILECSFRPHSLLQESKKARWAVSAEFLVLKNTNIINFKSNAATPKEFWRRRRLLTPSQPPSKRQREESIC